MKAIKNWTDVVAGIMFGFIIGFYTAAFIYEFEHPEEMECLKNEQLLEKIKEKLK